MSLDGAYDPDNIIARIIRGDLPSAKVFETDRLLAFMDAFPQTKGHCLVVHKASRARNLLDAEPEVLDELILAVQRISPRGEVGAEARRHRGHPVQRGAGGPDHLPPALPRPAPLPGPGRWAATRPAACATWTTSTGPPS